MRAPKKRRKNLAAEKLANALQEIAEPERGKVLARLLEVLDLARKKVLGGAPKASGKSKGHKKLVRLVVPLIRNAFVPFPSTSKAALGVVVPIPMLPSGV